MFFEIFQSLCESNSTTPNAVCKALGFSNSTATYWKKSGKPPKREHLEKIALYFGVSVDYLLGREQRTLKFGIDFGTAHTQIKSAPANTGESVESLLSESRTAAEWLSVLNNLNRDNKIKLFEYAQLLLLSQDQADKADP